MLHTQVVHSLILKIKDTVASATTISNFFPEPAFVGKSSFASKLRQINELGFGKICGWARKLAILLVKFPWSLGYRHVEFQGSRSPHKREKM